mmetsp:Transcript_8558/g.25224  ORF Transcript_8558/g.25224 Transcript_8558/m.25224 type:complete len:138 (+) Transcript_8558:299-712(+)
MRGSAQHPNAQCHAAHFRSDIGTHWMEISIGIWGSRCHKTRSDWTREHTHTGAPHGMRYRTYQRKRKTQMRAAPAQRCRMSLLAPMRDTSKCQTAASCQTMQMYKSPTRLVESAVRGMRTSEESAQRNQTKHMQVLG